ncbi:hypothetical protein PAN31117_04969 [Pandoraea anapnoica]|uniref:DUF3829 domain-containing protein n=1 Tax=Pandoraea anapnoica TaxID=2508301 RepID=A0A5E5APB7_9BURK|nr:hypothetical protein [Pandoraea anapnoica]VVE74632.1 hypothetical protein PAN31117_04969 [Pandoraea anapnoica]
MANRGVAVTACANAARSFVIVVAIAALAGCSATQIRKKDTLQDAANGFDGAVKASASALDTEVKSRARVRRAEAIENYVRTFRSNPRVDYDIDGKDDLASFARFVCAGSDSFVRERAAMRYATAYSGGLKDVLAEGDDSISGQWKRLQELRKPIKTPGVVEDTPPKEAVLACSIPLTEQLRGWKGRPTTDASRESLVAAVPAAIAAYKAIVALIQTGLTAYNDIEAKQRFADYVHKFHPDFKKVMDRDFAAQDLENAWNTRQIVALQRPLATFRKIFVTPARISRDADDIRIRELGMQVHDQLAEYDALHASQSPVVLRQKLVDAEEQLVTLVDDKHVSISDLVAFFNELKDDFDKAKTQYSAAEAAVRAVPEAWKQ